METIKVAAKSAPKYVAGAIAACLRDVGEVKVQAIGAKAVNQALKSIIVARMYCKNDNKDLLSQPEFSTAKNKKGEIVSITITVKQIPLVE